MKARGSDPSRISHRWDIAIAGLIVIIGALLGLGGCSAQGRERERTPERSTYRNSKERVEATIPAGWRVLHRRITSVVYPRQVLAAASFRARVPARPGSCFPTKVLSQMPPDSVLLQVFEYGARAPTGKPLRVPGLPPRPAHFRYRDADYSPFECAGLSHRFVFEQGGRAFQAHVWFDRASVNALRRADALKILDSFKGRLRAPAARYRHPRRP